MNHELSSTIKNTETKYYKKINEDYLHKNNSNISIHHRSKIRNDNKFTQNFNETDQNSYFLAPVYQTLKTENFIQNFHYQPSINFINNKENKVFDKFLPRQNTTLCLKNQSSFNGKIDNKYTNNINKEKKDVNIIKSPIRTPENSSSYTINNISSKPSSKCCRNIYSNRYSPHKSPENYLIKPRVYKDTESKLNEKHNTYKIRKNDFVKSENKGKYNEKKFEKRNHLETKIFNSKKKKNNKEITTNNLDKGNDKEYKENKTLIYKKYEKEQSNDIIQYEKSSKSIISIKSEITRSYNNNKFFQRKEVNKSNNKINIKEKDDKRNNNNKIQNSSINSKNKSQKRIINSSKSENNLKLSSISIKYKLPYSYNLSSKFIEILNKIIINRKYKTWIFLKNKLLMQKSHSNYKLFTRKIRTNNVENLSSLDAQSQISCTLENDITFNNNNSPLLNKMKEKYCMSFKNSLNTKNIEEKYNELQKDNLKLKEKNDKIFKENKDLSKKLESLIQQNRKLSKSPRTNNLMIENKILYNKLKNKSVKYLITKQIYYNENKIKNYLKDFNKRAIILKYKNEKKTYLLYKLIKIRKNIKNKLLRKYFLNFYEKTKLLYYKSKDNFYKKELNKINQKGKLLNIFLKKEKNKFICLKNCFNKFYFCSLLNKDICFKNKIIQNESISFNHQKKNNKYNSEKKKRKLKLLIDKNKAINNIIIKSILKQWNLRTKIINMKIINLKEEIIKKIIDPLENVINNKRNKNQIMINNNSKEDNIIKGIQKLNNIFMNYKKINKSANGNENQNNIKSNILNPLNNNKMNNNNFISNGNILNKNYGNNVKYKVNYDWVIEEKEEEQVEENGESTSAKNDTVEDNSNNINDYTNKFNIEFNNNIHIQKNK